MTQGQRKADHELKTAIVAELTWSEFRQTAHVAWATPGVTLVENKLIVIPDQYPMGVQDFGWSACIPPPAY